MRLDKMKPLGNLKIRVNDDAIFIHYAFCTIWKK